MINSIRKRYFKLNFTLASTAVLLGFISVLFFLYSANKYEPELEYSGIIDNYNFSSYKDLNRNGINEKYFFGKATVAENYFVQHFDENGKLIEQFNFSNPFLFSSIFNYDLNGDNFDELLLFTKNDSLLLFSILDIKNNNLIQKELPILKKPISVVNKYWDLNEVLIKIIFDKSLKRNVIYLSPLTGHSIYPRGLYKYDLLNGELLNKFETTAPVSKFVVFDTNNDGTEEIILKASSSGNTRDKTGIHDNSNWLIKLNLDFEFVNEPLEIGEFLNGIEFEIVKHNNRDLILFVFSNKKNQEPKEFFALMDLDFNIVNKKEFEKNEGIKNFLKSSNPFDNFFYITTTTGAVHKYDIDFNKLSTINLEKDDYYFMCFDDILDRDGKEILVKNQKNVLILSEDLEILFSYESDNPIRNVDLIKNVQKSNSELSIITDKNLYIISIHKNLLAQYRVPAFLLTSIIFYLILLLLHKAISNTARIIGAYNYSYDDINLGLIITDYKGIIKSHNKNVFYNLPSDSNIQKNKDIFTIFNQTEELTEVIAESFKDEKEVIRDIAFTKNDFRFIGKVQVLPLFTLFHIPHSFVIKIQNLTKEIEIDRSKLWARIAQKVAHDIKTPLSTIQLNLTALKTRISKSDINDKAPLNDDIEMIHEEIRQISELTKSFLMFSSLEKPNLQWTDIHSLIENSIKPFKKYFGDGINFEYEIQDDLSSVWVDPNQMVQMFHIFIENSIDAIEKGGFIKIAVGLVDDLQHSSGSYVEFLITDNGKGLSKEEKNKIFEPYFTQKKDGTGMGLTIAKKIVEDHGGTIDVQTKSRFGTTFIIKLPHNQPVNDA